MQRRPVKTAPEVNYPVNNAFLDRRKFLALLGGAAAVAALEGCAVAGGGMVENGYYLAHLPAEPNTHALAFPQEGTLTYVIEATTLTYDLYAYLLNNEVALLQKADAVLLTHAFSEFSPGATPAAVQQELMGVLADAYYGVANSRTTDFASLVLTATQQSGNPQL